MLLLTGGRGTGSVIYRVTQDQVDLDQAPGITPQQQARESHALEMRKLRQRIEQSDSLDFCWSHLNHPDRWIRNAARIGVERQPPASWEHRVWQEHEVGVMLRALLALVRMKTDIDADRLWRKLDDLSLETLSTDEQLCAIRIAQLFDRFHANDAPATRKLSAFESLYPTGVSSIP